MKTNASLQLKTESFWRYLFDAKSIAVIGAKDALGTWGYDAIKAATDSVKANPKRKAYPVNPNETKIMGLKVYKSILDIPGPVEMAIIVVPAGVVPQVFRQCAEKKIKTAVIISAGFGEVDANGAKLQDEINKIAKESGIRFIGPNCTGHADFHTRVCSIGFADMIPTGQMALLSQSGTLGLSIMQTAARRGIGFSKFVSTGNEANLRLEDYLEYLANDDNTHVISLYIEGLREGRRFFNLAKEITRKKPIIAVKSGTTSGAAKAARSHTGALSGSDTIYTAAFKQSGVIRVQDEEEMCDAAICYSRLPLPRGNRVAILTIGGGFGVVTAEDCENEGMEIATLQPETIKKMRAIMPSRWVPGNPVDLVGIRTGSGDNTGERCLQLLLEDKNVDAIISLLPPMLLPATMINAMKPAQLKAMLAEAEKSQAKLYKQLKEYDKPLVYVRRWSPPVASGVDSTIKTMIPEYDHPRRAARVFRYLAAYRKYLLQ
ncbi:MAG: CoA-binding protein [Dehalococcoidales bacterium]|nr:CoA-binding protein [Dehalococcoidales bacterium]